MGEDWARPVVHRQIEGHLAARSVTTNRYEMRH